MKKFYIIFDSGIHLGKYSIVNAWNEYGAFETAYLCYGWATRIVKEKPEGELLEELTWMPVMDPLQELDLKLRKAV